MRMGRPRVPLDVEAGVILLLAGGETALNIAEIVGVHRNTVSNIKWRMNPSVYSTAREVLKIVHDDESKEWDEAIEQVIAAIKAKDHP